MKTNTNDVVTVTPRTLKNRETKFKARVDDWYSTEDSEIIESMSLEDHHPMFLNEEIPLDERKEKFNTMVELVQRLTFLRDEESDIQMQIEEKEEEINELFEGNSH